MTDLEKQMAEALREERKVRLLGQEPEVHWESLRDLRRACYERTDAALAAYASQQAEPSEARVEAYTSEQHFALREAYCIAAGDAYFEARPFAPGDPRITFDAGFVRGFDKATDLADARAVLQAADAVSAGVPDGYVLVPEKATPLIREALRIGMRREVPNDDLCDIRWRAAIAAAQGSVKEAGND